MKIVSIAHLVQDRARSMPCLDVLTFEHEGQQETRSYAQLWQAGQALARGFRRDGVVAGDRIGLLLQNHPEFVEMLVASAILGTELVPLDPRMRGEKLAYMLADANCVGVVAGDYALAALAEVTDRVPSLAWVAVVGEVSGWHHALPAAPIDHWAIAGEDLPIAISDPGEPMQIMYTSGTTGDPKGIVVTHGRFVAASGYGEAMFGYREGDRPYTGLSLTHGNAQYVTLAPSLAMGLRVVFSRKFTKSRLWDIMRRNGCTTFSLLGGMATAIYSKPPREDDGDNPVRHVVSAGMPTAIWDTFRSRFDVDIIEFYGAMEGGLLLNPLNAGPAGSCGKPPPSMRIRIVDEHGADVPDGTPGELWFANADGTPITVSYIGNPDASAKKTEGGWLRTGDMVTRDADGWIFYQFRTGGGIRHNGEFINPALIEKTLAEHPEVVDVFVWGVPAASGAPGEKDVVATIVPREPDSFDPQAMFDWTRSRLEAGMVPSYVQHVPSIPKTASEKPQERFLRDAFEREPHANHVEKRRQVAWHTREEHTMSEPQVVLYGASGYTGKMIAGQLAARGIPFIAAGRNAERLTSELANNPETAGASYEIRGVATEVDALTELFRGKQAVYNTVGPMMQLASPIVEAALAAGCHYFDSSGEQDWTAHCRDTWGAQFAAKSLTLIPCMSMMWASGDLASALVLETPGIDTLDILYAPLGSSPSVASTLSFLRMCCQPQLKLVNKQLVEWPPATTFQAVAPGTHEVLTCLPWSGGAEPIWYENHATVRNCKVLVSFGSPEHMERTAGLTREFREKWADKPADEQERATNEMGRTLTTQEPPRDDPNISRTIVSCHGRGETAHSTAVLWGVRGYDQTGHIGAVVLERVLAGQLKADGFQSPSRAFGARELLGEWEKSGLVVTEVSK